MPAPLPLRFLTSASDAQQLPDSAIEVALVGRSNVGKSSLLNALSNRRDLARTSKTPGATRLVNVFELDPRGSGRWIVDLPGYGYARAPESERRRWQRMVEGYLTTRDELDCVLLLIDGEIGPTPLDVQTVEWLHHVGRPIRFVATKSDKVRPSRRPGRKAELAERLGLERGDVTWVSAHKGTGIDQLQAQLLDLLARPVR